MGARKGSRRAQEGKVSGCQSNLVSTFIEEKVTLAGITQWMERGPANQRVPGLTPSQGTCLGCGPDPQLGMCERQTHIDISLPLFLSPLFSLKINKII